MNLAAILRELDAEIEKLERARKIVEGFMHPRPRRKRKPTQTSRPEAAAVIPAPRIVVVPPKVKREYRPRMKPRPQAPGALIAAPFDKPVFVPRAAPPAPVAAKPEPAEFSAERFEAAVRENLLGGGLRLN